MLIPQFEAGHSLFVNGRAREGPMDFHHFETLGSTNDHLASMADRGAREWTVVVADRQISGRGRQSRDWWSPRGNLHMSILMRPQATPRELLRLPVLASLALLSAMGEAGSSLSIKWPNDIILEGRKMAGILTESRSEGEKVLWAIVGFGVNVTPSDLEMPADLKDRLAFVHELDKNVKPEELAGRIAMSMKDWSSAVKGESWKRAMEEWSRRALLHTPYVFKSAGRHVEGVPVRIDDSGGLVMKTNDGEVTVYSGELEEIAQSPKPKAQR